MTVGELLGSILIGTSGVATVTMAVLNATGFDLSPLLASGPIGIVCGWFMLRMEARTKALEAELGRLNIAVIMLLMEIPTISESAKGQAKVLSDEVDAAKRKREGK